MTEPTTEPGILLSGQDMASLVEAVLQKGAAFRFKATGISMKPSIRHNDIVIVSPLAGNQPFVGEIVAFRQPGTNRLVIHRVFKIKKGTFFIQGDNASQVDGEIPADNILGIVTCIERKGKKIGLPDRFHYPLCARLFARLYLFLLFFRRLAKAPLRGDL